MNEIIIKGTGTLIVTGDLIIDKPLKCQADTSFGVIVTGSITFNDPEIECGAYVALNGNIHFNSNVSSSDSEATGIFITGGNIILPSVSQGVVYKMKYDSTFGLEPSALFRDILKIVFSTSS